MQAPMLKKIPEKTPLLKLRAMFDRLRRKIEQLHDQLKSQKQQCEKAFLLYHSDLKPMEKKAGDLVSQYLLRITDITKNPKIFNKKQRTALENILKQDLQVVFNLLHYSEIDPEIKKIYKNINGKDCEANFHEEINGIKDFLKEQTGKDDFDLSDLSPNDTPEEVIIKIRNFLIDKDIDINEEIPQKKKSKGKKESIKEQKALELKIIQEKKLSTIYKRLAKEIHPDLEQEEEKRAEKVDLMKQITVAYENKDLLTLISLESIWLKGVDDGFKETNEEDLKAYNSLLKNQIEDLKNERIMSAFDPRYFEIHSYVNENPEYPLLEIQKCIIEVKDTIKQYTTRLNDLSGENPRKFLQSILDGFQRIEKYDLFTDIFGFDNEEDDNDDGMDFFSFVNSVIKKNAAKK